MQQQKNKLTNILNQTDRQVVKETHRQIDKQTDRQTDGHGEYKEGTSVSKITERKKIKN